MEYVYFIVEEPFNGNVKIGRTSNLEKHLKSLQHGCPNKLRIHMSIPIDESSKLKMHLHEHFKNRRFNGEWFKFDGLKHLDLEINNYMKENSAELFKVIPIMLERINELERQIHDLKQNDERDILREIAEEENPDIDDFDVDDILDINEKWGNSNELNSTYFANEYIQRTPPTDKQGTSEYYKSYCEFHAGNRTPVLSIQEFTKLVADAGYRKSKNDSKRIWKH
jgi:hypothetical protein